MLERRLIRIAEEIKTAATAEVERIAAAGLPASSKTGWAQLTEAFPTADQLLDEIQVSSTSQQRKAFSAIVCVQLPSLCCVLSIRPFLAGRDVYLRVTGLFAIAHAFWAVPQLFSQQDLDMWAEA